MMVIWDVVIISHLKILPICFGLSLFRLYLAAEINKFWDLICIDGLIFRAGHFRYFLIFSIINDFLHFLSS